MIDRIAVLLAGAVQVPLADLDGLVPGRAEGLGNRDVTMFQLLGPLRDPHLGEWSILPGDEISQPQSSRIHARHDGRTRWRTDRACRVRVGELHALLGQAVQVGRLVEIAAERAESGPAQVVRQEEDDIRPLGLRSGMGRGPCRYENRADRAQHEDGGILGFRSAHSIQRPSLLSDRYSSAASASAGASSSSSSLAATSAIASLTGCMK